MAVRRVFLKGIAVVGAPAKPEAARAILNESKAAEVVASDVSVGIGFVPSHANYLLTNKSALRARMRPATK